MEPKRHLKMKKMPPETHFEKDTVPKGPRDRCFLVFAAPEPLKMCLWPRRRAIFHIFTHFTFFTENEPKSHQKSSIWGTKMYQKCQRKTNEQTDSFLITFCHNFGSILGALGDPGASIWHQKCLHWTPWAPPSGPSWPQDPPRHPQSLNFVKFLGIWTAFSSLSGGFPPLFCAV